jgi:hypothetical protein
MLIEIGKKYNFGALNGKPYKTRSFKIVFCFGDGSRNAGRHHSETWKETLTGRKMNRDVFRLSVFKIAYINFIWDRPE